MLNPWMVLQPGYQFKYTYNEDEGRLSKDWFIKSTYKYHSIRATSVTILDKGGFDARHYKH